MSGVTPSVIQKHCQPSLFSSATFSDFLILMRHLETLRVRLALGISWLSNVSNAALVVYSLASV